MSVAASDFESENLGETGGWAVIISDAFLRAASVTCTCQTGILLKRPSYRGCSGTVNSPIP